MLNINNVFWHIIGFLYGLQDVEEENIVWDLGVAIFQETLVGCGNDKLHREIVNGRRRSCYVNTHLCRKVNKGEAETIYIYIYIYIYFFFFTKKKTIFYFILLKNIALSWFLFVFLCSYFSAGLFKKWEISSLKK